MLYKGEQRTRGDIKQEVRRDEIVWVYKEGSTAQRGKDAAKQHIVKRTRKCSKREGQPKGRQENIQNAKRSVDEYWSRKVRYT